MKKQIIILISLLTLHSSLFSQTATITNIMVSQKTDGSGMIDIYYDLSAPESSYLISLEVSFDNGSSFSSVSSNFISGNTGVAPGTNRHLVWDGKGSHNNTYSPQTKVKLIANVTGACGQPITDPRDGKTYNTVQIGTQCWMAQNMNIGTIVDIPIKQSNNDIIEKYCYGDIEANCDIYGGLYIWDEMMQYTTTPAAQGICPPGWHVPTGAEWCTVMEYLDPTVDCPLNGSLGTDVGGKMKSTGTSGDGAGLWCSPNAGANNESGFTALPGGVRFDSPVTFAGNGYIGYWWSSTGENAAGAWTHAMSCSYANIYRWEASKIDAFSARCLRD
ncbi:MAG: FISUMP domain-containing protein [bacterium]